MGIISRQLEEKMTLVRGKESLKIKTLVRTGRSCTAVVVNGKGKEEKLTISDMWNQKISILDPKKKMPEPKKVVVVKPKKEEKKKGTPVKKVPLKKTEIKRANGISTTLYKKDGTVLYSSWKRTR